MTTEVAVQGPVARLTVLCDNTAARPETTRVHGLAVMVETDDRRILFDTGADDVIAHNADALGVPLTGLDAIVLSHGHYDHVGGLGTVLARSGSVPVIAHPGLLQKAYARDGSGSVRYIGAPLGAAEYEALGARFEWRDGPSRLGDSLLTTTGFSLAPEESRAATCAHLLRMTEAGLAPDPFVDETSLVVGAGHACLVLTGCAHQGPEAVVRQVRQATSTPEGVTLMGGFHLASHAESEVRKLALRLHALGVSALLPCHCTGASSGLVLRDGFLGGVDFVGAGSVVEVWPDGTVTVKWVAAPDDRRDRPTT